MNFMRDKNIDNDINSNIDSETPDETELEGVAEETPLEETSSEEEVADNTNHESEEATNDNSEVDDDQEPTVRDNSYYARKRIEEREAKKRKQQSFEEEEDDEDYQYLDDYEIKKFDALLKKKGIDVEFIKSNIEENNTKNEISDFFSNSQNKDIFGKYEKKIMKYANHPSRKNIPIESIAYEVAGPSLVKELQDLRQEVAKYTKNRGTGVSGTAGNKPSSKEFSPEDILNMSKEDYQKYMAKFKNNK